VADFAQFDQAFRTTYQPLPPVTDIDPGDRQRVDMSDALAMDTLKALKASDQVVVRRFKPRKLSRTKPPRRRRLGGIPHGRRVDRGG